MLVDMAESTAPLRRLQRLWLNEASRSCSAVDLVPVPGEFFFVTMESGMQCVYAFVGWAWHPLHAYSDNRLGPLTSEDSEQHLAHR